MKKITLKKFNILVEQEVKEFFESGEWHKSELPEIEEAVIEMLDGIYLIDEEEENDFSQNPERQVGRFLTDEEKEQMRLEDEERKRMRND